MACILQEYLSLDRNSTIFYILNRSFNQAGIIILHSCRSCGNCSLIL